MNLYSVYEKQEEEGDSLLFINQKYSIIAGLFTFFWAAYHRMWNLAIFTLLLNFAVGYFLKQSDLQTISTACNFGLFAIFALFAPEIREYFASKKGYVLSDIILANSEEQAESSYFSRKNAS